MPAEEGPSLARTRTAPRSMMSRLRDDSDERASDESSRTTKTFARSYMLEQQLKDNEARGYERGTTGHT